MFMSAERKSFQEDQAAYTPIAQLVQTIGRVQEHYPVLVTKGGRQHVFVLERTAQGARNMADACNATAKKARYSPGPFI